MQLGRNEIIGVGSKHSMPGASGEFGERPFPQGFALAQNDYPGGNQFGVGKKMAGKQRGPPGLSVGFQQVIEPAHAGRVQAVNRLIQDEQIRVPQQGSSNAAALAHAQ